MDKKYTFVLDCDGVFTDGTFHYNSEGKCEKVFGPDDADALKLIKDQVNIVICSADHRGFPITKKRINDMGFELTCVKSKDRLQWIKDNCKGTVVAYMGDSFQDAPIFQGVDVPICTADSSFLAKEYAEFITPSKGGNRAVADAVFYLADRWFGMTPEQLLKMNVN